MNNFLFFHVLNLYFLENDKEVSATSRKLDGGKTSCRGADEAMPPLDMISPWLVL